MLLQKTDRYLQPEQVYTVAFECTKTILSYEDVIHKDMSKCLYDIDVYRLFLFLYSGEC